MDWTIFIVSILVGVTGTAFAIAAIKIFESIIRDKKELNVVNKKFIDDLVKKGGDVVKRNIVGMVRLRIGEGRGASND